jgi:hypothetical protein
MGNNEKNNRQGNMSLLWLHFRTEKLVNREVNSAMDWSMLGVIGVLAVEASQLVTGAVGAKRGDSGLPVNAYLKAVIVAVDTDSSNTPIASSSLKPTNIDIRSLFAIHHRFPISN